MPVDVAGLLKGPAAVGAKEIVDAFLQGNVEARDQVDALPRVHFLRADGPLAVDTLLRINAPLSVDAPLGIDALLSHFFRISFFRNPGRGAIDRSRVLSGYEDRRSVTVDGRVIFDR